MVWIATSIWCSRLSLETFRSLSRYSEKRITSLTPLYPIDNAAEHRHTGLKLLLLSTLPQRRKEKRVACHLRIVMMRSIRANRGKGLNAIQEERISLIELVTTKKMLTRHGGKREFRFSESTHILFKLCCENLIWNQSVQNLHSFLTWYRIL